MGMSVNSTLDIVSSKARQQIIDTNNKHLTMLRALAHLPYYTNPEITLHEKCAELTTLTTLDPSTYVNVAFYDKDGCTIYGDGSKVDFSDMDYVQKALQGQEFISDPLIWSNKDMAGRATDGSNVEDLETDVQILLFYAVPVYNQNSQIEGAMVAIVNGLCYADIVRGIDMGAGHHPGIVARTTQEIFGSAKNEGDSYINLKELFAADEFTDYKNEMLAGKKNRFIMEYPKTKNKTIIEYTPVEGTSWSVIAAVPYNFYFGHLYTLINFSVISLIVSIVLSSVIVTIVVSALIKPLNIVSGSINEIASGNADLTKRIDIKSKDEIGLVVNGFNNFSSKLQSILSNIKDSQNNLENVGKAMDESTQDTSASITEIIANIESVHKQIVTQTSSVQQTAGAVNQIASNIESLENLIENQARGVSSASAAVEEMMGNIESVNHSVDKMAQSFDRLMVNTQNGSSKQEDVSNKVEQIVAQSEMLQEANQVISNIAEQTNLLAMNAAIEAAHAGEAGKGFSVVADEIRKLSETSTAQSKTIGNQLNSIKESIAQVVLASEESNKAFISVSDEIKDTDELVRLIKAAMEEQTVGSQQINKALHEMNDSTSEVRTAGHEMAEGNKQILDEVKNLQDSTLVMKESMEEMSVGAERINSTGSSLNEITEKLRTSIKQIGDEIDLFKV
ncbi:MAG: HAMP domain-containing protein [Treponema sp.]|nr:HAMP domain-containing protein [Treponema sp.]